MAKNINETVLVSETPSEDTSETTLSYMAWEPEAAFDPENFKFGRVLSNLERKLANSHLMIHELSSVALYFAQVHNNYDMAGRLMTVLLSTPTPRREAIIGWFKKYSNIKFDIAGDYAKAAKNKSKNANPCNWEMAYKMPYWLDSDLDEKLPDNYTSASVLQSMEGLRKKIHNILSGGLKQKAEPSEVERLRFMEKSLAAFITTTAKAANSIHNESEVVDEVVETALDDTDKHNADETVKIAANG